MVYLVCVVDNRNQAFIENHILRPLVTQQVDIEKEDRAAFIVGNVSTVVCGENLAKRLNINLSPD